MHLFYCSTFGTIYFHSNTFYCSLLWLYTKRRELSLYNSENILTVLLLEMLCFQNKYGTTVLRRRGLDKGSYPITSLLKQNQKEVEVKQGDSTIMGEKGKDFITACNNVVSLVFSEF